MQQNRTLLLTDSLPCVQILRSAKTKDSTVYSLLVKLAGEYPNIMVNHCKGGQNISDLFSRQGTQEKDAFLEFKLCHLPREKSNEKDYFFYEKLEDWLLDRRIEPETVGILEPKTSENNLDVSNCFTHFEL